MSIQRIQVGPRMSQAVVHGNTIYLAGQCADPGAASSVTDQTAQVLGKIDALLAAAGSSKEHVLSATIWLTDMDTFADMNKAWEAWAPAGHTPARATVVSPRLAAPEFKVEIGIIAAKP